MKETIFTLDGIVFIAGFVTLVVMGILEAQRIQLIFG